MARLGITYDDVEKAARQLVQRAQDPAVDTIRVLLGNTGSKTTIQKHLKTWRTAYFKQQIQPIDPEALVAPTEVTGAVNTLLTHLNEQAQQQLLKIKAESDARFEHFVQENCALQQANAQLNQALTTEQTAANHLQTDLKLSRQAQQKTRHELALAQTQVAEKTQAMQTLQSMATAFQAALTKAQTDQQARFDQQVTQHQQVIEDWIERHEAQRQAFMKEMVTLKNEVIQAEREQARLKVNLEKQLHVESALKNQLQTCQQAVQTAHSAQQTLQTELADCRAALATSEQQRRLTEATEQGSRVTLENLSQTLVSFLKLALAPFPAAAEFKELSHGTD